LKAFTEIFSHPEYSLAIKDGNRKFEKKYYTSPRPLETIIEAQNHWVLETRKHNVSETGSVSFLR
jgi:hypothetical protein